MGLRLILIVFLTLAATKAWAEPAKVAIVIDDIGYRYTDPQALDLPGQVTYSVLPHTRLAQKLAYQAFISGREVLLHIPMEASNGKKLGPGALTRTMNRQQIQASLAASFNEIPYAIGINNHMGSLLTQLSAPMQATMSYLKQRNALFLDSLTTNHSVAYNTALQTHVPTLKRQVFLDNQQDSAYIEQQFYRMIKIANKHGRAIAIAHPHPITIKTLTQLIPKLKQYNIELVAISQMLTPPQLPAQLSASADE